MWPPEALRRLAAALVLGLAAAAPAPAETPRRIPVAEATAEQLGTAAVQAVASGRAPEAAALAAELLHRDPKNPLGHYIFARLSLAEGNTATARKAARRSFFTAQSPRQHYEAARVAGQAALAEKRFGAAAFWARQTIQYAPDDRARAVGVRDFRRLGALNPLAFNLKLGVRPSNNVNGGADDRTNVIDGYDTVGWLSDDAMALGGVVGTADASASLRVAQDATSQTRVGLSGYTRLVDFYGRPMVTPIYWGSGTPPAPVEIRNSDYSTASLAANLQHSRNFGSGFVVTGQLEAGRLWQGGLPAYDWQGLDLAGSKTLSPQLQLNFGAAYERRDWVDMARIDRRQELDFGLRGATAKGTWGVGLSASTLLSPSSQSRYWSVAGSASFQPKAQLGPLALNLAAGVSTTVYPDYMVLFMHPEGGRQDDAIFAELGMTVPKLGIAAFAPEVKLQALKVDSNVSRFSRSEVAVAVGWRSTF
ncbi:hypothetical protein C8J30_10736 [Rhodobacter viridis]|uniref:Tetratricopeptide repeat protein n=2 Tax=Rhodobacter viridis TaxID=1054202 RepID=A0A318TXF8_9RHOB|nr:hypothetical protein C8J30_10736 [Rhodobacter viridis]